MRLLKRAGVVAAFCLFASVAHAADYFPLAVGNWWLYQANLPDCSGLTCDTSMPISGGSRVFFDLVVTGTVRVDESWAEEPIWLDESTLPMVESGTLCYELEGSFADRLALSFGIRGLSDREPASLLVTQGGADGLSEWLSSTPEDYFIQWPAEDPDGVATWLVGARKGARIMLFGRRLLLWSLPYHRYPFTRSQYYAFAQSFVETRLSYTGDLGGVFSLAGALPDPYSVEAGDFSPAVVIDVENAGREIEPYALILAPDVGIVAVTGSSASGMHYGLVAKGDGGKPTLPTAAGFVHWGQVKHLHSRERQ